MNRVGPTTKTMRAMTTASTMLVLARNWMPRSMPDTAEATKQNVSTAMISTSIGVATSPTTPLNCRPLPIWRAPSPSEAAEPKSVAKMARMLMILPPAPSTARRPKRDTNASESRFLRPSRKVP